MVLEISYKRVVLDEILVLVKIVECENFSRRRTGSISGT